MVKYIQEGWVKWLLNWIAASSAFKPPRSGTVTQSNETNKRTSLHCKPLIQSKNEDTNKRITLLQSGQISPIKKEENTPLSPIVCIHCLQLDLCWSYWLFSLQLNRSLFFFFMATQCQEQARTKPLLVQIFFVNKTSSTLIYIINEDQKSELFLE